MKVLSAIYIHKNNDEQEKLVGSPVTSGDFNFAKRSFILSCGLRSKACVSWTLSLVTEMTRAPTPHSFLGRISGLPLHLKLFPEGCLIEMSC